MSPAYTGREISSVKEESHICGSQVRFLLTFNFLACNSQGYEYRLLLFGANKQLLMFCAQITLLELSFTAIVSFPFPNPKRLRQLKITERQGGTNSKGERMQPGWAGGGGG